MSKKEKLAKLKSYSEELGLNLTKPEDRFKWFLASIIFAKRISADIAKEAFRNLEQEELTSPDAILEAGWDYIVEILDSSGYTRYDFSTATNLLSIMTIIKNKYGDLERLHRESTSPDDLERRLLEFRGIGPIGVNIFLRELRGIWEKAKTKPSAMATATAQKTGLSKEDVEKYESSLVRLNLEYCKRNRCTNCPLEDECTDKKAIRHQRHSNKTSISPQSSRIYRFNQIS